MAFRPGDKALHVHHGTDSQVVTLYKKRPGAKWKVFNDARSYFLAPESHLMPIPEGWDVNTQSN